MTPDSQLLTKLRWLSSPDSAPCSLELTFITDFFLALAVCNSVVVSPASRPQPVVRTCFCFWTCSTF